MSLYNMIFGCDPRTPLILGVLGLDREDFGRFQDSFPNDGKYVVVTRIAGDANYAWVFVKMQSHPLFDGWSEHGKDIVFRFHKPTEHYTYPDTFVANFEGYQEAAYAASYLSSTKDRPLTSTA
jgi:hypothetical protein